MNFAEAQYQALWVDFSIFYAIQLGGTVCQRQVTDVKDSKTLAVSDT